MIVLDCEQGSAAWMEARRGVITASTFNKIITPKDLKPSKQAEGVARQAVAEWLSGIVEPTPVTAAMERGLLLEPAARAFYEFETGRDVQQVGFIFLDEARLIGCSPDGLVGNDGGLEIKCLSGAAHVECLLTRTVPDEYLPQIMGCLWITGRKWWDYVSYHPLMPPALVRVEWDGEYVKKLAAAVFGLAEQVRAMRTDLEARGIRPAAPVPVEEMA